MVNPNNELKDVLVAAWHFACWVARTDESGKRVMGEAGDRAAILADKLGPQMHAAMDRADGRGAGTLDWQLPGTPPPFLPAEPLDYEHASVHVLLCAYDDRTLLMGYRQQNMDIDDGTLDGEPKWVTSCSERWTIEDKDVIGWAYVTAPEIV